MHHKASHSKNQENTQHVLSPKFLFAVLEQVYSSHAFLMYTFGIIFVNWNSPVSVFTIYMHSQVCYATKIENPNKLITINSRVLISLPRWTKYFLISSGTRHLLHVERENCMTVQWNSRYWLLTSPPVVTLNFTYEVESARVLLNFQPQSPVYAYHLPI